MTTPPDEQLVADALDAGTRLAALQAEILEQKQRRRQAVITLRERGWSHQQVADALGVARGRAQDIWKGRS